MNKVFNINLGGFVFTIDEAAFSKLNNYINGLKAHFSGMEGWQEIVNDIESRMAEILKEKQLTSDTIITEPMVDEVLAIMGDVNEMEGENNHTQQAESGHHSSNGKLRRNLNDKVVGGVCSGLADYFGIDTAIVRIIFLVALFVFGTGVLCYIILWIAIQPADSHDSPKMSSRAPKKLFRDSDDKVIGGVCAGLAHYIGVDPVWVRIFFAVALFFFGAGFWIYIALWIAVQSAITTSQKLQMKGDPVDVPNMERELRNTFNNMKQNAPKVAHEMRGFTGRVAHAFAEIVTILFRIFGKVVALGFLVLAIALISFAVIFYVGIGKAAIVKNLMNVFLEDDMIRTTLNIGLWLAVAMPVLLLIITSLRLLFNIKFKRGPMISLIGFLWFVGWVLLLYSGVEYYFSVQEKAGVVYRIPIEKHDTLYLKTAEYNLENRHSFFTNGKNGFHFSITDDGIYQEWQTLNIIRSNSDSSWFEVRKSARGSNKTEALYHAGMVHYAINTTDSTCFLDEAIFHPLTSKWKFPDVKINLSVPVGTFIIVDDKIRNMIRHSKGNHWMSKGKTFQMTNSGLKCIDCGSPDLENEDLNSGNDFDIEIMDDDTSEKLMIKTHQEIVKDGKKIEIDDRRVGPIHFRKVRKTDLDEEK